ncbi:FtsX-like permease family protein [Clostridium tertium]|jgi:putative ABC transport system permease protein|uniref:FtsX-like permease family protein n=2 Tax=Clostridiaceae TaxID=31979 RepID=UPI001D1F95D9|nr:MULTISPECIES: FtsX-like permease family protein [Clostridium]MBS5306722.1 FtsX-like permease family protein [Clostridium sp.]MDB1922360.1 FtsX-like permease family protein [Clostridium tertium]MDB1926623.1 FtsX-like permease family protein [Clostridium tertium]MDB1930054.1 FtsX-like permease family protein [Clostridium tertium]MDB1944749.1 FtsX-like permease family protein [Clostridium tertium]
MKNIAYKKSITREILSSKARFISILAIIFLGVAFYAGIKSSGPDLKESINEFFSEQNLMDSKIVSSIGLNDNDLKLLENNDKILDYYATHSVDVNLTNTNNVVRFMEYDSSDSTNMNKPIVTEGRLPENSGEIALDENYLKENKNLKIGDDYTIESDVDLDEYFNKKTFKIVGFVQSPMYIENISRGTTTVGKGSIDYFAILNSSDISMDVYTEIYVRFKNVEDIGSYSDEYKEKMEENNKYLEGLYSNRVIERIEEIKLEAQKELDKSYKEIEDGEKKLEDAQKEIDDGKIQLSDGKNQYEEAIENYNQEIKNGELKLIEGEKQLVDGQNELEKQKEQFLSGEIKLQSAKVELDNAKQEFLNQGIDPTKSTQEYDKQIDSLNILITTYDSLSKDIKETTSNLKEGDKIPNEKIQYWKGIISNPSLGLNGLSDLVNGLEQNPENISLALNISKAVEDANKTLSENKSKLEILVSGIIKYQQGVTVYEEQVNIFNEGKIKLEEAEKQLDNGKEEIIKGKADLEEGKKQGQLELDKAKKELEDSEQKLLDGEKEIKENREKLIDGRKEIDKEKEKLNDLDDSKYYFFDREDNPGYSTYKGSIDSLDKIASVFPVFFFLVAALICLTTMTRMVEENRVEIGTLKALGYRDLEIARKFIVYAALASIVGSVLGIVIGSSALPYIIKQAYSSSFTLPDVNIYFYPSYVIQSLVASIVCTVGAALIVLKGELLENPSNLMRTKAPKLGKKILLERITPLWERLNFNQKVTFRNLFRYKQRMLMTILGISGCMAMLVAGLALEKSTSSVMDIQFGKLIKYDAMVVFNDKNIEKENDEYNESLKNLKGYESSLNIYQDSVTFSKEGISKQTATMYIPENTDDLNDYILLNDRESGTQYKLSNNGVLINEKLAKILNASVGDNIIVTDSDNNDHEVKVDNIVENYAGHYIYLSPSYYKEIFNNDPIYNAQLLKLNSDREDDNKLSTTLMDNDKVINVTLASKMRSLSESADLGLVMIVIIVASGSLAFVVLYNLININVSERIREISTIKVLGFYDSEVAMYIFRENIILTILGILAGSFLGKILYVFLVSTAEMDNMMMIPTVDMIGYAISGLITMFFAMLVMIMMHLKLKKVNMVDALKSIE